MQEAFNTPDKFSFHQVTKDKVRKQIMRLDATKATSVGDTHAGLLKNQQWISTPLF